VVRTFTESFAHVLVWLTYYDAILVGSHSPMAIDEAKLERRLAAPAIQRELAPIHMSTAEDFLSYFLMGTAGARAFGAAGDLNTDDNLVLEFSAPESQGIRGLDGANVRALARHRENILDHLVPPSAAADSSAWRLRWDRHFQASRLFDTAHAAFLQGQRRSHEVNASVASLQARAPEYAPLRFLVEERNFWDRTEPAAVKEISLDVRTARGTPGVLRISAVRQFLGRERVLVSFVDNARREVYGQRYIDGSYEELDADVSRYVARVLDALQATGERSRAVSGAPSEAEMAAVLKQEADRLVGQLPVPPAR
jgi:spermidine synthase